MTTTFSTPASFAYRTRLNHALGTRPAFANIISHHIARFQATGTAIDLAPLSRGTAIIQTEQQADAYLAAYGDMHRIKLESAFQVLLPQLRSLTGPVEVVDWGCGQGLASAVLLDFCRQHNLALNIRRVTLIEPSVLAINRAQDHLMVMTGHQDLIIRRCNQTADSLSPALLNTNPQAVKIHLFSNLLDMLTVDYRAIARTIRQSQKGKNLFVCVSPLTGNYSQNARLEAFRQEFAQNRSLSVRTTSLSGLVYVVNAKRIMQRSIQRNESIFSVDL